MVAGSDCEMEEWKLKRGHMCDLCCTSGCSWVFSNEQRKESLGLLSFLNRGFFVHKYHCVLRN